MRVPKELALTDVIWKEQSSLELFPFFDTRIRVSVDTSEIPITQHVDIICASEALMEAGRDADMEMAEALVAVLLPTMSTYKLECMAKAFTAAYDKDEAERQQRIAAMK
jgi:hypothetical protein